jgi:cardiolipin synthase
MRFFSETKEIWDGMIADIERAQISIELEQYSFWDDKIGRRFLKTLEKKHKEGVKIRVIVDGWGSYPLFRSRYVKSLINQGIEIVAFNPFSLWRTSTWFFHMHKKTLVIDSRLAWIGGLGIKKKFRGFKDTMVRFEGSLVTDIQNSFEVLWSDIARGEYYNNPNIEKVSLDPKWLINYCGYGRKEIYEQMRNNIQNAKKSIYLTTSYFFPDRNFFQLILDKARAGIDVKIILRGKDDEYLPVRFSTSYFHKALAANIGIYRYESSIIHAKTAIVDGEWATVGSSNLDKFSFYYNMEGNIASNNSDFVKEVSLLFESNLKNCRKIELKDWEERPILERVIEVVTLPIHNYL